MLLKNNAERLERNREKIRILLKFLKEETYSDFYTLKFLFGFKNHKSMYTLLNKVENMGLIQKHSYESHTMNLTIWGITMDGLAVALTPDDKVIPKHFQPNRVSMWSIDHHLDNQMARIALEKNGATNWINGDRPGFISQYSSKHRPDALITLPGGIQIAVETERNLKTKARYQSIMASHLAARTNSDWFYVFYITPDEAKKRILQLMFSNITYVVTNGIRVPLEARHHNVFRFYTIDELKNLELHNYA